MQLRDSFANWETGRKDAISASPASGSLLWFTIGKGILSETYFPSCDTISVHSFRFFVNHTKDESELPYEVCEASDSAPIYDVVTHFDLLKIYKEFFADVDASNLYIRYRFSSATSGSFKLFPFLKEILSTGSNSILMKTDTCLILLRLPEGFSVEEHDGFITISYEAVKQIDMVMSFGRSQKELSDNLSRAKDFATNKSLFEEKWRKLLGKFEIKGKGDLYKKSIIFLKCMEDKEHPGAHVASLALPWGSKFPLSERNGYHLVWVRDLFFVAQALLSAGDSESANNSLEYMVNFLMRSDGSFKQNSTISGEERWNATQMDQVAFPVILAWKLGRKDILKELEKSIEYILSNGPETEQERWEELGGFSPYSIALQARALEIFAEFKKDKRYLSTRKSFLNALKEKTVCACGNYGKYYFLRITPTDSENGEFILKGTKYKACDMVSSDFLYLVFTGILPHFDLRIIKSLEVVDRNLRVETINGASFYRYNGDIYGFDCDEPKGRLWVLLAAERGIFEYMRGNLDSAREHLRSVERFSTKCGLLPEQVFEDGQPTESATPLSWSHASYVLLYDTLFYEKRVSFSEPFI